MVTEIRNDVVRFRDETLARVRVLRVPTSERFPEAVKYAYHYGTTDGSDWPLLRFDNHHGVHEIHVGDETAVLSEEQYPGFNHLYRWWLGWLPIEKRREIE